MIIHDLNYLENFLIKCWDPFLPKKVLVVGGGRWGRVICSELISMLPRGSSIIIVSHRNYEETSSWARKLNKVNHKHVPMTVNSCIPDWTGTDKIRVAIVSNSTPCHYKTAHRLLKKGFHTLVEKPFVQKEIEGKELIEIAEKGKLILAVGLEYFLATYLYNFRFCLAGENFTPKSFKLIWEEPEYENRHGGMKIPDFTSSVIQDIFPHAWTIFRVLFSGAQCSIDFVRPSYGGNKVELSVTSGPASGIFNFRRAAKKRVRLLSVFDKLGRSAVIDFTDEPGIISIGNKVFKDDPLWSKYSSPLRLEFGCFFTAISESRNDFDIIARNCIDINKEIEKAQKQLETWQLSLVYRALRQMSCEVLADDVLHAIGENLAALSARHYEVNLRDKIAVNCVMTSVFYEFRRRILLPKEKSTPMDPKNKKTGNIQPNVMDLVNILINNSNFAHCLMEKNSP